MAKSKSTASNIKKQQIVISQQQRNNNPIFKTVYKRIRNLNKKLTTIDALLELDQATLKPQQIQKIASRNEVENQIRKNEEFILIYKSILDENNSTVNQSKDQVNKIATLLAVGQWIEKSKILGDDKDLSDAYSLVFKSLFNCGNNGTINSLIGDITTTLNTFLKNQNQYNSLKKYTAQPPVLAVKEQVPLQQKKQNKQQAKSQPKKQENVEQVKVQTKIQTKIEKKQESVTVPHARQQKATQVVKNNEKSEPSDKKTNPSQPAKRVQTPSETKTIQIQVKTQEKAEPKPSQTSSVEQNPQHKQTSSNQKKQTTASPHEQQKPKRSEYNPNRGYNKNYRNYNNGYREYGTRNNDYQNRNQDNYKHKQYKPKDNGYRNKDNDQKTRKPKNTRKGSDTSLEPTPEKDKIIQKPKYISKQ